MVSSLFTSGVSLGSEQKKEAIKVSADQMEHLSDQKIVVVRGKVVIEYLTITLKADEAELNTLTGDIKATGNVEISEKDRVIHAQSMEMNLQSFSGELYEAQGTVTPFHVTGNKMKWFGKERFILEKGSLTSCSESDPDWLFKFHCADIQAEHTATLQGISFWVKGIPVLYLPYFIVPAKTQRSSGFLVPGFGSSNTEGFILKNKYFWAISNQTDATIGLDYFSKAGLSPNLEYRYLINKESSGELQTSFLKDRTSDTNFYTIDWKHQQRWKNEIRNLTKVDLERKGFRQRFEDDLVLRTRRVSDSYTFTGKNWSDLSLGVEAELFNTVEVEERESFSRLPELSMLYLDRKLGNFPLYFSFDSSYVSFLEQSGPVENREDRASFLPTIRLPINLAPYSILTFSGGVRESFYSKESSQESFSSRSLLTGITLNGPIMFKEYALNSSNETGVRHFIEPRLAYKSISHVNSDDQIINRKFDLIDEEKNLKVLSFDLDHRFLAQTRSDSNKKEVWQIANLNLGLDYDLKGSSPEDSQVFEKNGHFLPLRLELKTFLPKKWEFNLDTSYDTNEGKFASRNVQFIYSPRETLELSLEKRFTSSLDVDYLLGKIKTNLTKSFILTWFVRYDEQIDRLVENNVALEYKAGCWSLNLSVIRRLDATKFLFKINLQGLG